MIRMTIAGEEVVSNKEFTITEEMLATSSTILNNCYPKTWEQDHDYVSRFYYPKDYSKCLINQITDIPAEVGEYATGSNLNINVDNSKEWSYQLDGNTTQNGTPTPASPVTVETVTGNQTISITKGGSSKSFTISLGNIELCKLGNYQDYIYKDGDNWYKHSEIGKYVYNNDITQNATTNNYVQMLTPALNIAPSVSRQNLIGKYVCNMITDDGYTCLAGTTSSRKIRVQVAKTYATSYAEAYSLFAQNNLTIYYVLENSSETQITDISLIEQLEALAGATLYNGTNNIVVSGSIPIVLNLHYNFVTARTENNLLFSGLVKNTGNISLRPTEPKYCSLQILDFKTLLSEGETLDFVISNKTVLEAIQMVVDAVSQYGFVLGNVNIIGGNDVIGAYSTQEKSAYDVFQYLADITQSRWSTKMVDENTVAIDFYDPTLMPQGIDIDYTKEWFDDNQVTGLTFNYGTRDYRNKQVMLSDQVYGGTDYIDTILGDGYNKSFLTTANMGLIKSITVNGSPVSYATNEDKELGIDADFYYTPGENSISTDNSYSAGTQIVVTYTPLIKGREVIYNTDEVQRINSQIGRKGVIARYEQRNDILTSDNLEKVGQAYIKYKGSAEIILTLSTMVDIYNIGEVVHFNAPITELDTDYMVKKKSTQIIATGDYSNIFYTYELTSSFNSESAINYFDNQRNKTTGNISQGEYITRNIDIENTANIIWDNLTITEVTIDGDNVLNSPLNSPFIQ